MPHPGLLHPEPLPLWQATAEPYRLRRHPNTALSQSLGGLCVLVSTGIFEPSERFWRVWGLILKAILPLLPPCWGFSFALGHGVSPHSRSIAYDLAGLSLTLIVVYLLIAAPAPHM